MEREIDINVLLAPIAGDNPTGEDLYYTVYDEIKEARRADDNFEQGDWEHERKRADWDKIITLSLEALTHKSKDIQIAAWLTEALVKTESFEGFATGLNILIGLLNNYWDNAYPLIAGGDIDSRVNLFEYMNDNLWVILKQIPLTDKSVTSGYSWLQWDDAQKVGYEKDIRNKYGDIDEKKKKKRDELIADGKITPEKFDKAVSLSSRAYYESLAKSLTLCQEEFKAFDKTVDEKFGSSYKISKRVLENLRLDGAPDDVLDILKKIQDHEVKGEDKFLDLLKATMNEEHAAMHQSSVLKYSKFKSLAPRLAELKLALADCQELVMKILEVKREQEPLPETKKEEKAQGEKEIKKEIEKDVEQEYTSVSYGEHYKINQIADVGLLEKSLWEDALKVLKGSGIQEALSTLYYASCSAPSVREKNRYHLLMAKLCLKAQRPDLARPIVEQLKALIEELHLERWESPVWIAEVLDALYQCLTTGEPSADDTNTAKELFIRLCTTDITKAINYKS